MKKQVAVVTGASSGIGKAICNSLMGENYNVVANGRSIKKVFKECDNISLCAADLLEPSTAEELLNHTLEKYGHCDVICVYPFFISGNRADYSIK